MEMLGYIASVFIGISLGLIGGGGSILAVPILVYLFGVLPELATSYSLCIVGIAAFVGVLQHHKLGNLQIQIALYFAIPSIISVLIVRKYLLPLIPDNLAVIGSTVFTKSMLLMLLFSILMLLASISMIRQKNAEELVPHTDRLRLIVFGFLVGIITGFLGAGGGFLIIPSLVFFAGLPMKQAVGTSLLIIFINSVIGFSGDLLNGVILDFKLLLSIAGISIVGMYIGAQLSKKIKGATLKPIFGWFVLIMGMFIIAKELWIP